MMGRIKGYIIGNENMPVWTIFCSQCQKWLPSDVYMALVERAKREIEDEKERMRARAEMNRRD